MMHIGKPIKLYRIYIYNYAQAFKMIILYETLNCIKIENLIAITILIWFQKWVSRTNAQAINHTLKD